MSWVKAAIDSLRDLWTAFIVQLFVPLKAYAPLLNNYFDWLVTLQDLIIASPFCSFLSLGVGVKICERLSSPLLISGQTTFGGMARRLVLFFFICFFYKFFSSLFTLLVMAAVADSFTRLRRVRSLDTQFCWQLNPYNLYFLSIESSRIYFYLYERLVFEISYFRLSSSPWTAIRGMRLRRLVESGVLLFFGVSRLVYRVLVLLLEKDDSLTWENYLFLRFNDESKRKILFIDKKFILNGKKVDALNFVRTIIQQKNMTPGEGRELGLKLNEFHVKASNLGQQSTSKLGMLKVGPQIRHVVDLQISKITANVAMYTDAKKAFRENYYSREFLVESFRGPKKETTLLDVPKTELCLEKTTLVKKTINEARGALETSYKPHLISAKFLETIENLREFDRNWLVFVEEFNVTEIEGVILKHYLFEIEEIFDWNLFK